jgi:hypothetical protein
LEKKLASVDHSQSHQQNASCPNSVKDLLILLTMSFCCRQQYAAHHHRPHGSPMVFTTSSRSFFASRSVLPSRPSQTKVIHKLRKGLTLKRFGATIRNELRALEVQKFPSSTNPAL